MSPTILLVSNDSDTREILQAAFDDRGHQVHVAADGAEGVRLSLELRPDVVVGDFPLDVPGHSPFTDHVRADLDPAPLLVSFTTRILPEDLEAARAVSDAVISKPADPLEVVAEVERLLAGR